MYNYKKYPLKNSFDSTPNLFRENMVTLYPIEEGYNKGNMFSNLYDQYKNYKPKELKANTEEEELLLKLLRMNFAKHEINLYLDLNPNDQSMLSLFNDYQKEVNNLMIEYEKKYGPINTNSDVNSNSFLWALQDFPWEGGNI